MRKPIGSAGFTPPAHRKLGTEHRTAAIAEFIASIGLALCTLIAATVVSVGIARADVVSSVIDKSPESARIILFSSNDFLSFGILQEPLNRSVGIGW